METTLETLRYPTGRFRAESGLSRESVAAMTDEIAAVPDALRAAVEGLSEAQLDTPYRPGGWTVRQVVKHLPDSHMNAYVRFKLTVTEDHPTIKVYDEGLWANLDDAKQGEIESSLALVDGLHPRWVAFLRGLGPEDLRRRLYHPEMKSDLDLEFLLQLYAWHGRHHVAHITSLREREGW